VSICRSVYRSVCVSVCVSVSLSLFQELTVLLWILISRVGTSLINVSPAYVWKNNNIYN